MYALCCAYRLNQGESSQSQGVEKQRWQPAAGGALKFGKPGK